MGRTLAVWAPDPAPGAHLYVGECVRAVRELGDPERAEFIWMFDWGTKRVVLQDNPRSKAVLEVYTTEEAWKTLAQYLEGYVGAVVYPRHCEDFVMEGLRPLLRYQDPKPIYVCIDQIYSPLFDPVRLEWTWEFSPEPGVELPPRSVVMGVPVSSELGSRTALAQVARRLEAQDRWLVFWGKGNVEGEWVLPFAPNVLWLGDVYPSQFHYLVQQAEGVIVPYFEGPTFEILTAWRSGKPVWAMKAHQAALAKYPVSLIGVDGKYAPGELYRAYCWEAWAPRLQKIMRLMAEAQGEGGHG